MGAVLGGGVRVILDLAEAVLAIVAVLLAIGAGGWVLDLRDWWRGL